jgi:hypothetical protein
MCRTRLNNGWRGTHAIDAIVNVPQRLAEIRRRLSDISWFMRDGCRTIGPGSHCRRAAF